MFERKFPRLYLTDPPEPTLPQLPEPPPPHSNTPEVCPPPRTYIGRRTAAGTVVFHQFGDSPDLYQFEGAGLDWRGSDWDSVLRLARILLGIPIYHGYDEEVVEAFAEEVVRKLPHDQWELTATEIRRWLDRWFERQERERWTEADPLVWDEDEGGFRREREE